MATACSSRHCSRTGRYAWKKSVETPGKDMLFDASMRTLFIVDHGDRSYYHIDQAVIDKAASLVEVAVPHRRGTSREFFADLLQTLGLFKRPGGYGGYR